MLDQIEPAVLKYAASRTIAADHIRHGAAGTRERFKRDGLPVVLDIHDAADQENTEATTLSTQEGNIKGTKNPDGTLRTKGCVIGHRAFVPRRASKTKEIKFGPGPLQAYTTKPAIAALKEFGQQLLPLTQTVEALFRAFLPNDHEKYTAAFKKIYHGNQDKVDEAFGIWTSRSLVINANTNNHKDLEDVCHGWCAIVALGDFTGGDACFPQLRVKIDCPPGTYKQLGQIEAAWTLLCQDKY